MSIGDFHDWEEVVTMEIKYKWTDGSDEAFQNFYKITEEYYSQIVGGLENRKAFMPFNVLQKTLVANNSRGGINEWKQ